ncbi:MAG: asparaginase [Bacteroidota bacterium]|nr:asparaginase [Bacteroidota bacterium]MDX5429588.1 asparaginase [Bacteroidota bacterium]MDX5468372.1 asparaginase [Bacteroidota bacterium]
MSNPILVEVIRGGVLESFHRGVICVVDREGKVILEEGDIRQVCYPRSALKFFQQIPLLMSGAVEAFGFTEEELAVTCGSHNGEERHVNAVDSILRKIGLDRSALQCGAQYPTHRKTANELIAKGIKPEAIHNNCSGKHAGFLALAIYKGLSTHDYLESNHPVQSEIKSLVADFHDMPLHALHGALDGCSAPIFAIPVYHQALAYMRLVNPDFGDTRLRNACDTLVRVAHEHPFMIAGTGRYCTDLMEHCGAELIGKTGAEGIYSLAFHQLGIGACIKIDDGKMLPQYHVAQKLVAQSGLFEPAQLAPLHHYLEAPIVNFSKNVTGSIRVSDAILKHPWR